MKHALAVLLALTLVLAPAFGDDDPDHSGSAAPRIYGRTVAQWVKEFRDEKDPHEIFMKSGRLRPLRFTVGAAQHVVPALIEKLKGKGSDYRILEVVQEFGPHATEALDIVDALDDKTEFKGYVVVTRICIGDDPAKHLKRLKSELKKAHRMRKKDPRRFRRAVSHACGLGVVGDLAIKYLKDRLSKGDPDDAPVLSMRDLGPAATPLVPKLRDLLKAKDDHARYVAVLLMAQADKLDGRSLKLVLEHEDLKHSGWRSGVIEAIALFRDPTKKGVQKYFRKRLDAESHWVRIWAAVGIARGDPGDPDVRKRLLEGVQSDLDGVRAAAAHGLLHLDASDEAVVEAAEQMLADWDLRVRWRAGALLLSVNKHVKRALAALQVGLEGPCPQERIFALQAIAKLGSVAKPLVPRIKVWAASPFERIAEPAKQALAKVQ